MSHTNGVDTTGAHNPVSASNMEANRQAAKRALARAHGDMLSLDSALAEELKTIGADKYGAHEFDQLVIAMWTGSSAGAQASLATAYAEFVACHEPDIAQKLEEMGIEKFGKEEFSQAMADAVTSSG